MHEKVREFLEKNRRGAETADMEARKKTLIRLGLWEKEYAPEDKADSPAYPERDGERRYRKAPVPVSEEEWTEIRKYVKRSRGNKIETALQILGILCYLTGILGLLQMLVVNSRLLWLLFWAVLGTLCLGIVEIIGHLEA